MDYKRLFVLLEGDDDEGFFEKVLKPVLLDKYDDVKLWKYAQKPPAKIDALIRSIRAMNAQYLYVVDINQAPCVTVRKQELANRVRSLDVKKTIVVVPEIEAWYLAGLERSTLKQTGITPTESTDSITKERFDDSMPRRFDSRIDFKTEILQNFSFEAARIRSASFRYFTQKHDC